MRVHYAPLAALLLAACSSSEPSEELPVLSLAETDLPGVFEVTAVGMDEAAGFTFTCDDQVTGTPTLIDGLWLAARDRVEVEARCGLQGVTLAGGALGTGQRTLRPGMLEAQAQLLDPIGDSGLDPWEQRALGDALSESLPLGVQALAWRDERRRLVLQDAQGRSIWARRWGAGGVETQLLEGDGRPGCDGSTDCAERLLGFFENPQAPDLLALPDTNATVPGLQAHSFGADTTREGAAFLAWGAGVDASSTRSTLDSVDVAPTLAAALGLGETLGRAPDGALGLTALARVDGQAQPGVISSGSTQQVVLIVVDGLSDAVLDEFIDGSQGFSKLKAGGLHLAQGLKPGYPSLTQPTHHTLLTGLWSGHHGVYHNRLYDRADGRVDDLMAEGQQRLVQARSRATAETLYQALTARPNEAMESPWSVTAGSPAALGATTNTLERTGPGGEGWLNIGREPGFADLPAAPDGLEGAAYEAWERSIILAEYTQRMITGLQVPGDRPNLTVTRLGIYHDLAAQFGVTSEEAQQALGAIDVMLERLMSAMERREWQDTVTVIVTGGFALHDTDPNQPLAGWWAEGSPWVDQGVVARSVSGQITVEAMAFERRVENGFVHLKVRDADSARGLGGVTLTTYSGDGEELGTRLSDADGAIDLPQPNDRSVYGVLRADGYSELRLTPGELQL